MILDDAHEAEVDEENYFVSMTDMMVGIVFIFIIMLMYFAVQFQDITDQLTGANIERAEILKKLQRTLKNKGIVIKDDQIDSINGIIHLPDEILFDRGQAELKFNGKVVIGHLADALSEILPCYTEIGDGTDVHPANCSKAKYRIESVYVEGHTDHDNLSGGGLIKNNLVLSVIRATNTYELITSRRPEVGKRCSRKGPRCEAVLSVSGYGKERPLGMGDSDAAKQRNRRIDLRLTMVAPDSQAAIQAVSRELQAR